MSELEKKVMETMAEALPHMSEAQQGQVLGYGEGVLDTIRTLREMRVGQDKPAPGPAPAA